MKSPFFAENRRKSPQVVSITLSPVLFSVADAVHDQLPDRRVDHVDRCLRLQGVQAHLLSDTLLTDVLNGANIFVEFQFSEKKM
jgi:hypothetical protein